MTEERYPPEADSGPTVAGAGSREASRRRRRIDAMTPAEIVVELDRHIVGQTAAKRALAIAIRNRHRRRQLPFEERRHISPKNIMMIGPSGVGKTEIVRRVAAMLQAPFLKVEATKYTEVGYVGRDVETIVSDLIDETVARMHDRRLEEVHQQAERRARERLVDYVFTQARSGALSPPTGREGARIPLALRAVLPVAVAAGDASPEVDSASRKRLGRLLGTRKLDDTMIEIQVTPELDPFDSYWDFQAEGAEGAEPPPTPPRNRTKSRTVCVRDAKRILTREEANKLVDFDAVVDEALERAEDNGIVFIDEIDKIVGRAHDSAADVSGEGVQRDLLPIIEGSTVMTRYGPVSSRHLLFIAAGSFTRAKPSDLIPELQGRFPLRVELSALDRSDLEQILTAPQYSLCAQYQRLLATESLTLEFTPDGIEEIADVAWQANRRLEDIGARRLQTVVEQVLEETSFRAPELTGQTVVVDRPFVQARTGELIQDEHLERFIL